MFSHPCIKCAAKYDTEDPDPYYCPTCNEARKAIAAEIDKKVRPSKQIKSDFQIYDEMCKLRGTPFINAKDLGL